MMRVAVALLLASCGDPILDTTYRGEPIWEVEGAISAPQQLDGLSLGDEVRASFFWIPNLSATEQLVLVEQTSVTAEVRFPATFEVRVYKTPTEQHFVQFDGRYAAALLLIYVDEERDGFYSGADQVVGGTLQNVLLFAREEVPADESPTGEALPIGFSIVTPPLVCPQSVEFGREEPFPIPERWDCGMVDCGIDAHCNPAGWCVPEYPLTIFVSDFIPKDILCPQLQ